MRLQDVYYTTKKMDTYPEPLGKPAPVSVYQGDDIVFDIYLNYESEPVELDRWYITALLKTTAYATTLLWEGALGNSNEHFSNHIEKLPAPGMYRISIPASFTKDLIAGTYWLDVAITEQAGAGNHDLRRTIARYPFSLEYANTASNVVFERSTLPKSVPEPVNYTSVNSPP